MGYSVVITKSTTDIIDTIYCEIDRHTGMAETSTNAATRDFHITRADDLRCAIDLIKSYKMIVGALPDDEMTALLDRAFPSNGEDDIYAEKD